MCLSVYASDMVSGANPQFFQMCCVSKSGVVGTGDWRQPWKVDSGETAGMSALNVGRSLVRGNEPWTAMSLTSAGPQGLSLGERSVFGRRAYSSALDGDWARQFLITAGQGIVFPMGMGGMEQGSTQVTCIEHCNKPVLEAISS
jgi:hypothetical protein